jgi:hypothetical protein
MGDHHDTEPNPDHEESQVKLFQDHSFFQLNKPAGDAFMPSADLRPPLT